MHRTQREKESVQKCLGRQVRGLTEEHQSLTAGPLYPCNPYTARSESVKLSVDPKGEKLVYVNNRAVVVSGLVRTSCYG